MGTDIRIMMKGVASNVIKMIYSPIVEELSKRKEKYSAVVLTKNNYIKKLDLQDIMIAAPSGIILTKLNPGDEVKDVLIAPNKMDVVVYSDKKALRFPLSEVPLYKRNTLGVFAMNTSDELDGMSLLGGDTQYLVVITSSGKVNKISSSTLSVDKRYKAGSSVIKLGKGDSIFAIFGCNDNNVVNITTKQGKIELPIKDIALSSTVSAGTKSVISKGDSIAKITLS